CDQFSGCLKPILCKSGLQTDSARPLNAHLHIMPVRGVLSMSLPLITNTGAPRECDAAVHDQRFSMVAMIEMTDRFEQYPVIPGNFASAFPQDIQNFLSDCSRSERIQQKFDLHSGAGTLVERFREAAADITFPIAIR